MNDLLKLFWSLITPLCLSLESDGNILDGGGDPPGGDPPGGDPPSGDPPSTDFRDYIEPNGDLKAGWSKVALGEQNDGLESKFTTFGGLSGSYVNLERTMSSQDRITVPGPDATEEEVSAFHAKIGRPEKPEDYSVDLPDALKKSVFDEESVGEFKSLAHKLGLTPAQMEGLTGWYGPKFEKVIGDAESQRQQQHDDGVAALKKEWGADYDAKLAAAERGAAAAGMTAEDLANNPELSNSPAYIKAMAKVGEMVDEKPANAIRQQAGKMGINTPEEALAKIAEIRADLKHPYHHGKDPRNAAAQREMDLLYAIAYPEE